MIILYPQGWEEIPYDPIKGDISVDYYLICELEGGRVVNPQETVAFGYSSEYDLYFELYERLEVLQTEKEIDGYVVASLYPANRDNTISIDQLLPPAYKEVWLAFHRRHYENIE